MRFVSEEVFSCGGVKFYLGCLVILFEYLEIYRIRMKKRVKLEFSDCLKDMDIVQPEIFRDGVGGTAKTIASGQLQQSCG